MAKFNHAVTIAFEVITDHPEGDDFTPEILRQALLDKINQFDREDTWIEAVGRPFDTYQVINKTSS